MNEKHERELRRRAVRLYLQGLRPRDILVRIPRSREWLRKWVLRFQQNGWAGLRSGARRPRKASHVYGAKEKRVIVRVRRNLEKRKVGLIGPRAILTEIERAAFLTPVPSRATQ